MLPDHFMTCRKWNQMTETLCGDGIAVVNVLSDGTF
jgi:hypothetical protein